MKSKRAFLINLNVIIFHSTLSHVKSCRKLSQFIYCLITDIIMFIFQEASFRLLPSRMILGAAYTIFDSVSITAVRLDR